MSGDQTIVTGGPALQTDRCDEEPARGRWRLGIRARTMFVAAVVVGVALALAMVGLVLAARANLAAQITANAKARAQDVALLAKAGTTPSPIPGRGEALLVQVVDARGKVLSWSSSIEGEGPLVDARARPGSLRTFTAPRLNGSSVTEVGSGAGDEGGADGAARNDRAGSAAQQDEADEGAPFLIVVAGTRSPSGPVTVIVAAELGPIAQLTRVLVPPLATGLPVIVIVVALTVWALTGRALRPVEAIRAEAEAISASALDRRVPVPPARDEIGRLAETMNHMLDRLEASALRQRRFVADASHELKSPVAVIRTMLEVARRQPEAVDLPALLDDLTMEDARLERLTADLLTLARSDEGETRLHAVDVDLDDVVLTGVAAVGLSTEAAAVGQSTDAAAAGPTSDVAGVSPTSDVAAEALRPVADIAVDVSGVQPVRLQADPEQLGRLLRNLLENASRHASGLVWVACRTDRGNAVLSVSDDGPGISAEDRERVFERFVRLDESRGRSDGGTGLGLSVCRVIAEAHGGEIRAVEPEHGGATFEVCLPLRR